MSQYRPAVLGALAVVVVLSIALLVVWRYTQQKRRNVTVAAFWAVAGVAVAILALAQDSFFNLLDTRPNPTPSAVTTTPSEVTTTAPPVEPSTVPATASPIPVAPVPPTQTSAQPTLSPGAIRWTGEILFVEEERTSTDLDLKPPRRTSEESRGDIHAGGLYSMASDHGSVTDYDGSSSIAKWTGSGQPNLAQCRETADAAGVSDVRDVRKGTILCVRTDEDRIAHLKIVEVLKFDGYRARVTVWETGG